MDNVEIKTNKTNHQVEEITLSYCQGVRVNVMCVDLNVNVNIEIELVSCKIFSYKIDGKELSNYYDR